MPRQLYRTEPRVVNTVINHKSTQPTLEFATTNENKLREIQRILSTYQIIGKKLDVEEIQSLDPHKVARQKAIEAHKQNGYNPIYIEETSLQMMGLGGRPGTYIKDFATEVEMRRMIAETWLKEKDRRAVARVILAIFDGEQVHMREGVTHGTIAETLRGSNGFGWDDLFIPEGETRTFAEMSNEDKDQHSMRRKALENLRDHPVTLQHPIFEITEPYEQELARVNLSALQDEKAMQFAFSLECLGTVNPPNPSYQAPNYTPIHTTTEDIRYYLRYIADADSPSLGLILTDIDRNVVRMNDNGTPILWQYGAERRHLALAQRADFFLDNQCADVHAMLTELENGTVSIAPRNNIRSLTVESVLGLNQNQQVTSTYSFKDLGYKKISSERYMSRTLSAHTGLFHKIGKYPRSVFALGSMPAVSGWRDVLVMAAIGHHAVFTHRNNILAGYIEKQARLIRSAQEVIASIGLSDVAQLRATRNIGAAIGCGNVAEELASARYLYEHAGVRLFRIYTINSDPRVIETAEAIRQAFGDEIELFVGQVSDHKQALQLIAPNVRVDGLFFGHGGGRQCTSATNGMAVTTLEEVYQVVTDERFNDITIAVEGGVGTSLGHLFLLGIDLISYNQQFAHCVIEQGDLYFEHHNGKITMPYHGSASAPTMIIESANPELAAKRLRPGGRTRNVEGRAGYRFFEEKANSMSFYLDEFKHYAARTLADLGVHTFAELRQLLSTSSEEWLRVVSSQASAVASAYGNSM